MTFSQKIFYFVGLFSVLNFVAKVIVYSIPRKK